MCSGLRHFVLDLGAGFELERNHFWSVMSPVIAVLLTVAVWVWVLVR
jgi:succinate dehydrogenase / fumarate reductase cytochrome b subunit